MPRLLIEEPSGFAYVQALDAPRITLGRAETNDVVLADPRVSRAHAAITVDHAFVAIEDLSSMNGVFVNGRKVEHEVLASGDLLTLGNCRIRFVSQQQDYLQVEAEGVSSIPGLRMPASDTQTSKDTKK
jgi:pSer/pThr/pTyr-binding forkhead associated (FHA) protein